jgi:hypothetical protein
MLDILLFAIGGYSVFVTGSVLATIPELMEDLRYINQNTDWLPPAENWADEEMYAFIRSEAEEGRVGWSRFWISFVGYLVNFHIRPDKYVRKIWHDTHVDPLAKRIMLRKIGRQVCDGIRQSLREEEPSSERHSV